MLVPTWMGANMPDENQQKTSVTEFWYKCVNLFLEELINIKVILFLIHELFRWQNSPKYVTFFNLHDNPLARHVNATSRTSLEIQAYSITKPIFEEKIGIKISFQLP